MLFGPVLIAVVFAMLFVFSGWGTLSRAYGSTSPSDKPLWRYQSGSLGAVHFGRSLTLGSDPDGLYIAVMFPFSIAYKSLLIPWDQVAVSLKKRFFMEYWEFHFGQFETPTLKVGKKLGQKMIQASLQKTGSKK